MVVTDQMGITQPSAIRAALERDVAVNLFAPKRTYHPKVFIGFKGSQPLSAVIGSANVSYSGLVSGEEVGVVVRDKQILAPLGDWFSELFKSKSKPLHLGTQEFEAFESGWRTNALKRIRSNVPALSEFQEAPLPATIDSLEDLFAAIQLPIATLGMDQAGNNIRNLEWLHLSLSTLYPDIGGKARSDLKLLGLYDPRSRGLTDLGIAAQFALPRELSRLWVRWLLTVPLSDLIAINARLVRTRSVLQTFTTLQRDVQSFFIDHVRARDEKEVLQSIELLCNGSSLVNSLRVDDFRTVTSMLPIVRKKKGIPPIVVDAVDGYKANKGTRGWDYDDRALMVEAAVETLG